MFSTSHSMLLWNKLKIPKSSMNLLIPNCASSPKPFRVEHKLVGAESTKLSMSECVTLTGSEVLKEKKTTQYLCMWLHMCVCV